MLLSPLPLSAENTAPSFDCAKAEKEAEKMVCSDAELARLDRELNRVYILVYNDPALDAKAKRYLRASQVGWIKGRDETWKVEDKKQYVTNLYVLRIAEIRKQYPVSRVADSEGISSGPIRYDCSGEALEAYFVQSNPPQAVIYHKDQTFTFGFSLVPSASGTKYVKEYSNGKVEFWSKGNEALFTPLDGKMLRCEKSKTKQINPEI